MTSIGRSRPLAGAVAALTLSLAAGTPLTGQEVESLTLEEAVVRALRVSPLLAQSEASLDNAHMSERAAYGGFLPNLSLSSGTSRSSTARFDPATQREVSGSAESYNAGLSLGYDLFSGGRKFAELGRARADLGAAEAGVEDQRFAVILQTKQLFFNALRQADLLEVAEARVRRAEESLENTRRRTQLGTGTRSDTLRARLELANARQGVLQAEDATRAARFSLGRLVGATEPVVPETPEGIAPSPLPLGEDDMFAIAEESSPSVRAAASSARAAVAAATAARSARFPSLRVSSGYDWSNSEAAFDGGRTSWNIRLSGSYALFDGFSRDVAIERAENTQRVSRLQEEDARRFARMEADAALRALQTAERAIEIAEEAVAVATEDLRVVQERYNVAVATILDLITSQIAVEEAESGLVTARYDYAIARAELEAILGRAL